MPTAAQLLMGFVGALSRLLETLERVIRRLCANGATRLALFAALALVARWPLLSTAGAITDFRDAEYNSLFEEAARIAVAKFHQAPFWNPYYCGGLPALATPSARFASPTFALTLLLGTLRADSVIAFFMTVVGLEGAFRYSRSRGASAIGAAFAAPIFALSGIFATAPSLGWMNFFGFELIPWVAYGTRLAITGRKLRGVVIAAGALGWIVGFGGTYATPLAILLCTVEGVEAVVKAARRPARLAAIARASGLIALLALGLAAIRLWPIAELLTSSPRVLGGTPGNDVDALIKFLLGENGRGGFLVGSAALPVAAIGIVLGLKRKRSPPLLLAAGLWLWLAAGYTAQASIFAVLRTVPPFTMLRYPERFLALFALSLAALAALGVSRLEAMARRYPPVRVVGLVAAVILCVNAGLLIANSNAEAKDRGFLPPPPEVARDFKQARGNRWLAAEYPAMGRGSLSCFDDYEVPQSKLLRGDLSNEEYFRDPSAGDVRRVSWSPNEIDLHVRLTKPARLYVNQNWHPGWRSSLGDVHNEDGLLTVDLPAGEHDVAVRFLPKSAVGGAVMSITALIVAALLWVQGRGGRATRGGRAGVRTYALAAIPLLLGLAVRVSMAQPPIPPRPLIAPTGEPIVADAPPEDAAHVGAEFSGGITLEAARLRLDDKWGPEPSLVLELDWRLAARATPGMGVFVHLVGSPGDKNVNVDHVLVSSVIPFESAPVGVTLRDISTPIALPTSDVPRTWTVHAGLWMARRGGERVPVVHALGAHVEDNRVLVGTFDTP